MSTRDESTLPQPLATSQTGHDRSLRLFFGRATDIECRAYAAVGGADEGLTLNGSLTGPECRYARTLPATYPLVSVGRGSKAQPEAVVPDPCFWTPTTPYLYRCHVELRRGDTLVEQFDRPFGIRPLVRLGTDLLMARKRWVLRGAFVERVEPAELAVWHEAPLTLMTPQPSEELCAAASELGVLLAACLPSHGADPLAEIERLGRWPAVGVIVAGHDFPIAQARLAAPNVIFAQRFTPGRDARPAAWAELVVAQVDNPADFGRLMAGCRLPVAAIRQMADERRPAQPAALRLECDRLQRDLAPQGQFAGYVV